MIYKYTSRINNNNIVRYTLGDVILVFGQMRWNSKALHLNTNDHRTASSVSKHDVSGVCDLYF